MTHLTDVLLKHYPDKEWVVRGDTYADIEWLDTDPQPTELELDALMADVDLERQWANVRKQRDALLVASDVHAVIAYEQGKNLTTAFVDYRQELRDIPETYLAPEDVVYPTIPTVIYEVV